MNVNGYTIEPGAILEGADLVDADLRGADLRDAILEGARLEGARLEGADLEGADLEGANLRYANLRYAYLQDADLRGANLEGANLRYADLEGADLRRANLQDANLYGANLRVASLRGAIGLPDAPIVDDLDAKILAMVDGPADNLLHNSLRRALALSLIVAERNRQNDLKAAGRFPYTCADSELSDAEKLTVLAEEFGEAARAVLERNKLANDTTGADLKKELVQVAAVAVAWIESLT
jgi:uncharacterized protein YjbI with pentapeptide repeats